MSWPTLDAMRFPKAVVFIVILLTYLAPTAYASVFHTAVDLSRSCKAFIRLVDPSGEKIYSDIKDADLCADYVEGAMDAYDTVQGLSWSNPSKWICAPDHMQVEQAVRVFLKYADNHPEGLRYPAANVVWLALHDAFPCPAK